MASESMEDEPVMDMSSDSQAAAATISTTEAGNPCQCKSTCSRKRVSDASGRGCPGKGDNRQCTAACKCGTRAKPCQNKGQRPVAAVSQEPTRPSEDEERNIANQEVKEVNSGGYLQSCFGEEFIQTLDAEMTKKLCIRSLQRGIGSMDYADSLLIMEDEDENTDDDPIPIDGAAAMPPRPVLPNVLPHRPGIEPIPEWCRCSNCQNMSQEIENQCCKKKNVSLPRQDS